MNQAAAEGIQEAARAMKVFREETLPRIVLAERLTDGLHQWWADWKRGRS